MPDLKKQHYVPQCYLGRFADRSGKIHVYDKVTGKIFATSPENIAQESYFYDIPTESLKQGVSGKGFDLKIGEKALSVIERYFTNSLNYLLKRIGMGIHPEQKYDLAIFMAIQWIRTKAYRKAITQISEKGLQALADDLTERNFPGQPPPKVSLKEHSLPVLHYDHLFNQDHWEGIANELVRHIWLAGINWSGPPLYTSDAPVVRRAHLPHAVYSGLGMDQPGVEFAFPVTPKHILTLKERTYFWHLETDDCRSVGLSADEVAGYNRLQVERSGRWVFCSAPDFALAQQVCKERPEIRDPDRPVVRIDSFLTGDLSSYLGVTALE